MLRTKPNKPAPKMKINQVSSNRDFKNVNEQVGDLLVEVL